MPNKHKKSDVQPKLQLVKAKVAARAKNGKIAKLKNLKTAVATNTVSDNRLELLVTIVNRNKGEYYSDLIQSFDVNMQFAALGAGTADQTMLSRLGFADSDKIVIFSIIQGNKIPDALSALEEKFRTIKNGKGIAYTIPFSGVIGTLIFGFLSNNRNVNISRENDPAPQNN
ncbi:MAG: hypothetical protein OSJ83_04330 [Clostridia bacterium]|nr:hypothetical protein [Clostridia bacterium]